MGMLDVDNEESETEMLRQVARDYAEAWIAAGSHTEPLETRGGMSTMERLHFVAFLKSNDGKLVVMTDATGMWDVSDHCPNDGRYEALPAAPDGYYVYGARETPPRFAAMWDKAERARGRGTLTLTNYLADFDGTEARILLKSGANGPEASVYLDRRKMDVLHPEYRTLAIGYDFDLIKIADAGEAVRVTTYDVAEPVEARVDMEDGGTADADAPEREDVRVRRKLAAVIMPVDPGTRWAGFHVRRDKEER